MGGIVLDTNVLINAQNNKFDLTKLPTDSKAYLPSIVISELYVGVILQTNPTRKREMEMFVDYYVKEFDSLPFTLEVAITHSKINADIKNIKKSLDSGALKNWKNKNAHDIIIGATALHHGFSLVTANAKDFKIVDGLNIIDTSIL